MKKALKALERGTVFSYAGHRWIALEHDFIPNRTLCLLEEILEDRAFDDGNCNNWGKSSSRDYMNGPFLDTLIDKAGSGNAFIEVDVDLTADDGLKDYGTCKATIFLLTADQYRRNRDVITNADDWWWLATAVSTADNGYESSARRVYADGTLNGYDAYGGHFGLRPACYLDSDLLISIDEGDALTTEDIAENAKKMAEAWLSCGYTAEELVDGLAAFYKALKEVAHE